MTRRPLAVSLAVLALAAAIVGSVLVGAPPAEAHAILTQSDPPVNAQLSESPQLVSGFFSEPVDDRLSSLEVFNGSGDRVDNDDLTFGPEPERMSITLKDD
jgi:copper transport protein